MSDQLIRHSHRRRRVGGATGLINVSSYLRDLFQLISLLHADEKVAGVAEFKALSEVNHETEVNRLLIWIATASRQVLDMNMGARNGSLNDAICGKYWDVYSGDPAHDNVRELQFRQACNIIIHAIEITSYDPDFEYHRGVITVRGQPRRRSGRWQANRAMLDFERFAKHCIRLSKEVE